MQIHEITTNKQLDEGIMDLAKSAAGAVGRGAAAVGRTGKAVASPFKAVSGAYKSGAGSDNISLLVNKASSAWNKYAETLKATTPDPARYATLYKQTLTAFVQKNLLGGQPINSAVNKQEIMQAIDAISAAAANPRQVTQLFSKLVQQASVSQQDVEKQQYSSGQAQIINRDPAIVKIDGRTYGLNDNGQWADIKNSREPEQSVKAYLDQLAGIN